MIRLQPLPGTPFHQEGSFEQILHDAVASARALQDGGADGCLIQTVDRVYGTGEECDPARIAAISLITRAVSEATGSAFQVGVQLMRNAVQASLAVAKAVGGTAGIRRRTPTCCAQRSGPSPTSSSRRGGQRPVRRARHPHRPRPRHDRAGERARPGTACFAAKLVEAAGVLAVGQDLEEWASWWVWARYARSGSDST